MADEPIPPSGDPPPTNAPSTPIDRSEDIKEAAELGRVRAERERATKDEIERQKKERAKREHEAMDAGLVAAEEKRTRQKSFFTMKKQQEKEAAEYKIHHEKELAKLDEERKARDAKRQEKQKYMNELHENARIKQAAEMKKAKIKAEMERERANAEHDYRRKVAEAERLCASKKEDAEKDNRAKKAVNQSDLKAKLYQEETHFRSKTTMIESEARRVQQAPARNTVEHANAISMAQAQLRIRKKKLGDEHKERKETLERDARQKDSECDGAMYLRKTQADSDLRETIHRLDNELARRYNDIELTYRKRLIDSRMK